MACDTQAMRPDTTTDRKRPSGVFAQHPVRPDPETGFHTCPKAGGVNTTADDAGDMHPVTLTSPRRRGLLTGTIAALLAGTAAVATAKAAPLPATGDDARLQLLHSEMIRRWAAVAAIEAEPIGDELQCEDQEERMADADHQLFAVIDEIETTHARALPGLHAKAGAMLFLLERFACVNIGDTLDDVADGTVGEYEDRMALSLARDIMSLEVVA
jgi:hypothetical protein